MDRNKMIAALDGLIAPAVITVCGLVLLLSPDTASAMVSLVLGWILILWAVGCALMAVLSDQNRVRHLLMAAVLMIFSRWLQGNPLALAAALGRILGIGLILSGGGSLIASRSQGGRLLILGQCLLGLILLLLPMTTSRLVFSALGLLVTAAGIAMLVSQIRKRRWLHEGDDPNIIDAL